MKSKYVLLAVSLLMVIQFSVVAQEIDPDRLLEIIEIGDESMNTHNVDLAIPFWLDDVVFDYVPLPTPFVGKDAFAGILNSFFVSFPDLKVTHIRSPLVSGNIVVVEHEGTGTHLGEIVSPLGNIPPTGKSFKTFHMDIFEFEGEKIKKATTYDDMASQFMQLGILPASEPIEFIPSFTLPAPEPTGLSPLEAYSEQTERWNSGDLAYWAKMIHPEAQIFVGVLGVPLSRDDYVAVQELYLLGFSDRKQENIRTIDLGDGWILNEMLFTGTNDGLYFGIPPTGLSVNMRAGQVSRFDADGLLIYQNSYYDNLTILAQLGLLQPPAVTPEELLATAIMCDDAINTHNAELVLPITTEDMIYDYVPLPTPFVGNEMFVEVIKGFFSSFPDMRVDLVRPPLVSGNIVVVEHLASGTHLGEIATPLGNIPPTGKVAKVFHMDILEFEGNKVKKSTTYDDMAIQFMQLGILPAMELPEFKPSFALPAPEPTNLSPMEANISQEALWSAHDLANYSKLFAEDADIMINSLGIPMTRDAFIASQEMYFAGFPDVKLEVVRHVDMGDGWVLAEHIYKGTNTGSYMGLPPTGRQIAVRGAVISRLSGGLQTNFYSYWDQLTLLAQLGMLQPPSETEANKSIERQIFEEVWNKKNFNLIDELCATDCVVQNYPAPPTVGTEAYKAMVAGYLSAFPNAQWTIEDMIASGDFVAARLTGTGTHEGAFMGVPPTQKQVTVTMNNTVWIVDGKIKESWNNADMLGLMQQIGALPSNRTNYDWGAPSQATGDPGDPESNMSLVRRDVEEAWNQGLLDVVDEIVSADFICHTQADPNNPLIGAEAAKEAIAFYLAVFPDFHMKIENIFAEGDKAVMRWSSVGTQKGELMGIPPTGRKVSFSGIIMYRFADGKIVENWWAWDALGLVQQLTAVTKEEVNKAIMKRVYEEIVNQQKIDVADEIFASNHVEHMPPFPDFHGAEGMKLYFASLHNGFPDVNIKIDDQIAEGNMALTRWTCTGTHLGEFAGVPATGIKTTTTGMCLFHIENGQAVEDWTFGDFLGLMQQLGVVTPGRPSPEDYMWGASSEVTGNPGDPEENKAIVKRVNEEFWNKHSVSGLDETHSPDALAHNPNIPGSPLAFDLYRQVCLSYISAFPDFHVTENKIIAEGDKVVVHWTINATHEGELMGIPATGRKARWSGLTIYRFADGKIVESWWSYDGLGLVQQLTAPSPLPEGIKLNKINSPSLKGNLIGDPAEREFIVYLPPNYDRGGRFPVVYLLHGYSGSARTFVSKDFTGLYWPAKNDFPQDGLYGMMNDLIASGKIKEMIVVMPDASNRYGGSWYTNSILTGNYEDYIVNDLVSYIDSHYRTIPNSENRAIVGHSMGGYGAMKLAMKHPDIFGAVASHSGSLYFETMKLLFPMVVEENPDGMEGPSIEKVYTTGYYAMSAAFSPNLTNPPFYVDLPFEYPSGVVINEIWSKWLENDAFTMLGEYGENLASMKAVYLDCGDNDEMGGTPATEVFHQALVSAGINHKYEIYYGGHFDRLFEKLGVSLSFISDTFTGIPEEYTNVFFVQLSQGLNMISLPLMPITPYTAKSFAQEINATVVIRYNETAGKFEGFALNAPGDGFSIEGGKGYIINVPKGGTIAFTGAAWTNEPPVEMSPPSQSQNTWAFMVSGFLLNGEYISLADDSYNVTVKNLQTNSVYTETVHSIEGYFSVAWADLNRKSVVKSGDKLEIAVTDSSGKLVSGPFIHEITLDGIRNALIDVKMKLGDIIPAKSELLQNYPNPFNPETWIPYQLKSDSQVAIQIYSISGELVRKLDLGYKPAGIYSNKARSAYWDGKNETGESVSSGVYFYTIKAGDYTATKKMIIQK